MSREIYWSPSTVGSPHALVVGIPGQGKSVTSRMLLRGFQAAGVATFTIDFHGDMAEGFDESSLDVIDVSKQGLPFNALAPRLGQSMPARAASLEVADIFTMVAGLGEMQRSNVYRALLSSFQKKGWSDDVKGDDVPSIEEFLTELRVLEQSNKGKNAEARLLDITEFGLFRQPNSDPFTLRAGRSTSFDLSKMGSDQVKLAAASFLLRKIYNEMFIMGQQNRIQVAVLLDEAHLLSKDPTVGKLLKEGRKFGVSLILVSQSIDDFPLPVTQNVGLKIAFRTNFPGSRKVAALLNSTDVQFVSKRLENLQVGEAIVSLPEYSAPLEITMER